MRQYCGVQQGPQRNAAAGNILLCAHCGPQAQVIGELEELEVGTVAKHWRQELSDEAALDAPLLAGLDLGRSTICLLLFLSLLLQQMVSTKARQTWGFKGTRKAWSNFNK